MALCIEAIIETKRVIPMKESEAHKGILKELAKSNFIPIKPRMAARAY